MILGTFIDEVIHLAERGTSTAGKERRGKGRGGGKGVAGGGGGGGFQMSSEVHIISHFGDLFVCTGKILSTVRDIGRGAPTTCCSFFWSSAWPPSQLCEQGGGVPRP